jgi:hypothetical protein
MKAYVNVLILFLVYYTNVLTRKEYWSHEYGKLHLIKWEMTFSIPAWKCGPKVRHCRIVYSMT